MTTRSWSLPAAMAAILPVMLGIWTIEAHAQTFILTSGSGSPPNSYIDEKGQPTGKAIEITVEALQRIGVNFSIHLKPWKQAYRDATTGKVIVTSLAWSKERAAIFDYSHPIAFNPTFLAVRKGDEFAITGVTSLAGKRIAMLEASNHARRLANVPGVIPVFIDGNISDRLLALKRGEADAAIINSGQNGLTYHATKAGLNRDNFSLINKHITHASMHIAIAKKAGRKDLITQINQAIEDMKADGTLFAITDKYRLSFTGNEKAPVADNEKGLRPPTPPSIN